ATNSISASVRLPGDGIGAIATDSSAVWVEVLLDPSESDSGDLASLIRVDRATNSIIAEIPLGKSLTGYEDHVIEGAGSIWLLGARLINDNREKGGDLIRVDPTTNRIVATIPVDG